MIFALWSLLVIFLFVVFVALYFQFSELWRISWHHGVPALSSTWAIVDRVIASRVFPAKGLILDLGCGNGWTLRRFFRAGIYGPLIGYEREFVPWCIGQIWNALTLTPVQLIRQDFSSAPFEDASGIYLFLLPQTLAALAPELERRCKQGTVIVSAEFAIPGWAPETTLEARGVTSRHAKIFCYRIGG